MPLCFLLLLPGRGLSVEAIVVCPYRGVRVVFLRAQSTVSGCWRCSGGGWKHFKCRKAQCSDMVGVSLLKHKAHCTCFMATIFQSKTISPSLFTLSEVLKPPEEVYTPNLSLL